jgi:hypothetical protein
MAYQEQGSGPPHFDGKNYQMWSKRMAAFLRGKGQILWDVTVDTSYVQPMNFLAPGSRDIFDANNKVVDYLFLALCQPEFDRVHTEHLACRIWSVLKEAHVGNAQVQARMYVTYRREYENFTHLPGESIDALFQRFTVVVNNMRDNVGVLPYDDDDRAVKLIHSLDLTVWGEGPIRRTREGGSEWEPIKILLDGDENSNKTNTASNTRLRLTTQVGQAHVATGVPLDLGTKPHSLPTRERSGTTNPESTDLHRSDRSLLVNLSNFH